MAESIYKLFDYESPATLRSSYLKGITSPTSGGDLYSQLAQAGTNTGALLGYGLGRMFGYDAPGVNKAQAIDQVMSEAAKGSSPLAQATRAYEMFSAQGMGREAAIAMERLAELKKESDTQNVEQEKKAAEDRFAEYMATADLTDTDALKSAAQAAFENKQNTLGKMFMEQYYKNANQKQKGPELRNYNKGDQTIYEQWNPTTKTWEEYAKAPRSVAGATDNRPEMQKLVEWASKDVFSCNYKEDSTCRDKVDKYLVDYKRQDPSAKVGSAADLEGIKTAMKALNDERPNALVNRRRIIGIDNAVKLLSGEKGAKPILGSLADTRAGIARFAALFGIKPDNAVSVTEALKANRIEDAARLLGSGAFGAGTGISDRDLLNAFTQVGAETSLTEEGVSMILQQLRDTVEEELSQYAKDIENTDEAVFKYAKRSKKYYLVDIPKRVSTPTVKVPENLKNLTDEQLEQARREAARTSYVRGGK